MSNSQPDSFVNKPAPGQPERRSPKKSRPSDARRIGAGLSHLISQAPLEIEVIDDDLCRQPQRRAIVPESQDITSSSAVVQECKLTILTPQSTIVLQPKEADVSPFSYLIQLIIKLWGFGSYDSGMSHFKINGQPETWIHRAGRWLTMTVDCLVLVNTAAILMTKYKPGNYQQLMWLGDSFIDMKETHFHSNLFVLVFSLSYLIIQTIRSWYATFAWLPVFQMLIGLTAPQEIGLTNEMTISKFVKSSKLVVRFFILQSFFTWLFGSAVLCVMRFYSYGRDHLLLAIAWSIIYHIWCYAVVFNLCSQFPYYYIICRYLTLKMGDLNKHIYVQIKWRFPFDPTKKFVQLASRDLPENFIQAYNSMIGEVDQFNRDYWMYFILLLIGTNLVTTITMAFGFLATPQSLYHQSMLYGAILNFTVLALGFQSGCQVHRAGQMLVRTFAKMHGVCRQKLSDKNQRIRLEFQIQNLSVTNMSFSAWNLFTLNNKNFLKVKKVEKK